MTVYFDRSRVESGHFPAILAIGDSWFWYPFVSNLLAELSAMVKPDYSNVLALGMIGATLESYAKGKFAKAFARELRPNYAQYYSAILISGGGNDAVDWAFCLKNDCTGLTSAADCLDPDKLTTSMQDLAGWLLALINEVHAAFDAAGLRRPDIFVHCYDYAPPNGEPARFPLFGVPLLGPWFKPAMDAANVQPNFAMRQEIVRILMDHLQSTFAEFDSPGDRVHVIKSVGTLDPATDWANELHPTGEGFRKLMHGPWLARLRTAGFAA
jgi:hypothetical protein